MKDIQKAEQKMREVADAINEAKRRIEIGTYILVYTYIWFK